MRRLLPILLITAVLMEIAGYYCIYVIRQFSIKESARAAMLHEQGLAGEARFAFKLKNNLPETSSFMWTGKDEFTYKGMMFDVSQKEINGDSIILFCRSDIDELSLIEKFKSLFSGKPDNKSSENNSTLLQFLSDVFIPVEQNELAAISAVSRMHTGKSQCATRCMSYDILKPPPRHSCVVPPKIFTVFSCVLL